MTPSIRYILICALRDRLFLGLILGIIASAGIAAALGGTAFLEEREMTLAYAGASARLILMVGLIVFVCFHIRSAFDAREIEVMLSRPMARETLVLAYFAGFATVAFILSLVPAAVLAVLGPLNWPGLAAWSASLVLEAWLVVAMALFAALLLGSAVTAVLATLGFYILSRLMAFFVLATNGMGSQEGLIAYSKYILHAVSAVIPRLDFFGQSSWLVYGIDNGDTWLRFAVQGAVFVPILLVCAMLDFRRREF